MECDAQRRSRSICRRLSVNRRSCGNYLISGSARAATWGSIWGDVGLNISKLRGSSSRNFRPLRSSKCFGIWSRTTGAAGRDGQIWLYSVTTSSFRRGQVCDGRAGNEPATLASRQPGTIALSFQVGRSSQKKLDHDAAALTTKVALFPDKPEEGHLRLTTRGPLLPTPLS
jgi:hypothetical protein